MRIHTDRGIAGIRFSNGRVVPLEDAFRYADENNVSPAWVVWADGFESYAKGWWDTSKPGWPLCSIGAGAYGSMLIATSGESEVV